MRCQVLIISHSETCFIITVYGPSIDGTATVEDTNIIEIKPGVTDEVLEAVS